MLGRCAVFVYQIRGVTGYSQLSSGPGFVPGYNCIDGSIMPEDEWAVASSDVVRTGPGPFRSGTVMVGICLCR